MIKYTVPKFLIESIKKILLFYDLNCALVDGREPTFTWSTTGKAGREHISN